MKNVVELKTRPKEIVESVIARLEEALERAREGEIVALAIATIEKDGSTGCSWSETDDFGRLLGSIARLQYRINVNQDKAIEE